MKLDLKKGTKGEPVGINEVIPMHEHPAFDQGLVETFKKVDWCRYRLGVDHQGLALTGLTADWSIEKRRLDDPYMQEVGKAWASFMRISIGEGKASGFLTIPTENVPPYDRKEPLSGKPVDLPPLDLTLAGRPLEVRPGEPMSIEVFAMFLETWPCDVTVRLIEAARAES